MNWQKAIRRISIGLCFLLLLSMAGWFTPLGDSLAPFRVDLILITACATLFLVVQKARGLAAICTAIMVFSAVPVLWAAWQTDIPDPDLTFYQHNLLYKNARIDRSIADILETAPDVVAIQEVAGHRDQIVAGLKQDYPHYQMCSYANSVQSGSVGILVRDLGTLIDYGCAKNTELAWVTINTETGPLTFASLHLFWPWPEPQAEQFDYLRPALKGLTRPIIIGGDFNNAPWSNIVQQIAKASGTHVAPGLAPTFVMNSIWPRLRLDHVLVPQGASAQVTRRKTLGSDHHSLFARINLNRP